MSIGATLKYFPIICLLFVAHFRHVNNVEHTRRRNLIQVDKYNDNYDYDYNLKLTNYLARIKRSPTEDLTDDEDVDRVSEKLKKKIIRKHRHRKKHRNSKKSKLNNDKENLLSESLTSDAEGKQEFHGDAVGNPCVAGPCAHGGTCIWNRNGRPSFLCECKLGYQGKRCEREAHLSVKTDGIVISEDSLQTIYIIVAVVGSLLGLVAIGLCIHCCRVWNKRLEHTQECIDIIENGGTITKLPPGVCEISNSYCREFWCCGCCDITEQKTQYDQLINEFKNSPHYLQHTDSDFPEYQRRLVQSEGTLPRMHQSFRSFRSLPAHMKSFSRRPSWLPDADLSNDEDSVGSYGPAVPQRTRPRGSSTSRESFTGTSPNKLQQEGKDVEHSIERIDDTNIYHQSHSASGRNVSPHHVSESTQPYRYSKTAPDLPSSPNRTFNHSPNQHSSQPVFPRRPSVRNILTHLSETHPPLPRLPPRYSESSSTFS